LPTGLRPALRPGSAPALAATRSRRGSSAATSGQLRQQCSRRHDARITPLERVGVDERGVDHDLERVCGADPLLERAEAGREPLVRRLHLDAKPRLVVTDDDEVDLPPVLVTEVAQRERTEAQVLPGL